MREKRSPENSGWGWKLLIVALVLGFLFMLIFYLAVNNDPDYMPSHNRKQMQMQHQIPSDSKKEDPMHMDMKDMPMDGHKQASSH